MSETRPAQVGSPIPDQPNVWFAAIRKTKKAVAEAIRAGWTPAEVQEQFRRLIDDSIPELAWSLADRAIAEQVCLTTQELEAERSADA